MIEVGKSYSFKHSRKVVGFRKIHILAIVDETQVVFKWYGRHKQWWHYDVKSVDSIELWLSFEEEKKAQQEEKNATNHPS